VDPREYFQGQPSSGPEALLPTNPLGKGVANPFGRLSVPIGLDPACVFHVLEPLPAGSPVVDGGAHVRHEMLRPEIHQVGEICDGRMQGPPRREGEREALEVGQVGLEGAQAGEFTLGWDPSPVKVGNQVQGEVHQSPSRLDPGTLARRFPERRAMARNRGRNGRLT